MIGYEPSKSRMKDTCEMILVSQLIFNAWMDLLEHIILFFLNSTSNLGQFLSLYDV